MCSSDLKPPMAHWLMAACSLPQGYVNELTARLPSAIAYTALMAIVLIFFGRRMRFQEAFIAVCLLFTCVEIHRAGMTARVDMVLTSRRIASLPIEGYVPDELLDRHPRTPHAQDELDPLDVALVVVPHPEIGRAHV